MGLKILIAPARGGKTDWVVKKSLEFGMGSTGYPFVVVPSELKVDDFRQRLAARGGAMGVQVGTFRDLSRTILDRTNTYPLLISETSQGKLLQNVLSNIPLIYYEGIKHKPGFIQVILQIIRELEAGGITPENFLNAIDKEKQGERLGEIGQIYQIYLTALKENNWVDSVGLTWKACEILSENSQKTPLWVSVIIDGFDDLSPIQLGLVRNLAAILPDITITLTGEDEEAARPLVHKRFNRLQEKLRSESKLESELIRLERLEELDSRIEALVKLEKQLFETKTDQPIEAGDAIKMMAVPDRESEVRESLRWIRSLIIQGEISSGEVALITRNQEPYRALVSRISREYRLPVKILGGLPLFDNPAVSAIMSLLNLARGRKEGLTWHEVRTNWQSPYFNWQMGERAEEKTQIQSDHIRDGNNLVKIARWGSVIQGYEQWREAFGTLIHNVSTPDNFLESIPDNLPTGEEAEELWEKFASFVDLILPPEGEQPLEVHLGWVESLLGEMDLELNGDQGLGIFLNILESSPDLIQRDWSALKKLSDIFRELLWSNLSLGASSITFGVFLDQLTAVIKRSSYQPIKSEQDFILFADSTEVSGMTFKAVALIGLAEGEFPGSIREDPFLRDDDRNILQSEYGLPLRSSTDSAEAEYFYESVSLPSRYLLLTRPRIADNGALWQPSPYWEEILRVVNIEPELLTNRNVPSLGAAASINEIFENFANANEDKNSPIWKSVQERYPQLWQKINLAQRIISARDQNWNNSDLNFNGALMHLREEITRRFPEEHIWSASRLENYQTCPFNFFVNNLLGLEKPEPPSEGLDARQLGNIYHHILEDLYRTVEVNYTVQNLLNNLPQVAEKVFKEAPLREGFRETAWWKHTQEEILTKIKQSIIVLESLDTSFKFHRAEQRFGLGRDSNPQLVMNINGQGSYQLRGFIDRVDHNQQGDLRIIDYKTSGAFGFDNQAVREGKKLQLPLYALAAQDALNLGTVKEGYYFHVRSAQPSSFKMSSFWNEGKKGVEAAMESAKMNGWLAVRAIQGGRFSPKPPKNGCPPYCHAIDFCWQYRPKRW